MPFGYELGWAQGSKY